MIFLFELTKVIPEICDDHYKKAYPLSDACDIFNFILENDLYDKIKEIKTITKNKIDDELYNRIFRQFSPYINTYSSSDLLELIFEMEVFPKDIDKENSAKISKITDLIRKNKIITVDESNKEYYFNYFSDEPFCINSLNSGEIISEILKANQDCDYPIVYVKKSEAKLKNSIGYMSIGIKEYSETKRKLDSLIPAKQLTLDPSYYTYNPPHPVLKLFDKSILTELKLLLLENKTRIQFVREDPYLSRLAANHLVKNSNISYYDLKFGIPYNIDSRSSIVFDNFDTIVNSDDQKKISDLSEKVDDKLFVILESMVEKKSFYFKKYEKVNFPNKEELLESITAIFISMLFERGLINKKLFYLIPLLQKNLLKDLLKDFKSLEELDDVLNKFANVMVDDLYNNVAMWYYIKKELNRSNPTMASATINPKKKLSIIYKDEKLHVIYNQTPEIFNPNKANGLLYICAIILNSKYFKGKELDQKNRVDNLRMLILELKNETKQISQLKAELSEDKYSTIEKTRKTIYDAISNIKNKLPMFDLIIRFSENRYHLIDDSDYIISVEYPKLENIITSSLK